MVAGVVAVLAVEGVRDVHGASGGADYVEGPQLWPGPRKSVGKAQLRLRRLTL